MANNAPQSVQFVFQRPIRILYTDALMVAKPFKNDDGTQGMPRFNCQGLIPLDHPQINEFKALVMKVAREGLPVHVDAAGQWTHAGLKLPLKTGEQMIAEGVAKANAKGRAAPDREHYRGNMVLFMQKPEKAQDGRTLPPPRLVVMQGGAMREYVDANRLLAKDFFYNGVLAAVSVQLKAFTGFGGGVTCYIDRVMSLNVGDRINIGRSDEDVFGTADSFNEYIGHATSESVIPAQQAASASPW